MEGATPPFLPLVRHRGVFTGAYSGARSTLPVGVAPSTVIPGGKASRRAFALMEDECLFRVALCSFVTSLSLHVLLCVFMLHHVPLHILVSPENRQCLRRLRTERHLNVDSRLRVLTDEALEEQ